MHPVLFTWGPIELHSYGVTLFLAIATAYFLVRVESMRRGESSAFVRHLSIAALVGGWLGSKLWYLAEHRDAFLANPFGELFAGSGQVFLGALVGGVGALLLFLRLRRRRQCRRPRPDRIERGAHGDRLECGVSVKHPTG